MYSGEKLNDMYKDRESPNKETIIWKRLSTRMTSYRLIQINHQGNCILETTSSSGNLLERERIS